MAVDKAKLTEKNYAAVYNTTTKPKKPKRRDKSDLGPDFVAPDGGWGWIVCFASGFSNLSIFPPLQQYGLIYRHRMKDLGFVSKQTTTIVNIVMALSAAVGIFNGAIFRRFTFRQVSIVGSIFVFLGIFSSAFSTTFLEYIICLSTIYGIGLGLCMASVALAVNTYFKQKRRRATGFTWTITGLGPIIFPHVSTLLLRTMGSKYAILTYSGMALNALACALTLQPVMWHVKNKDKAEKEDEANVTPLSDMNTTSVTLGNDSSDYECKYCEYQKRNKRTIFSSMYLFNEDDAQKPGYEITEPGIPMMASGANDGWYGSRLSLAATERESTRQRLQRLRKEFFEPAENGFETGKMLNQAQHELSATSTLLDKPNHFNREAEKDQQELDDDDTSKYISKNSVYSKASISEYHCTCSEERILMQKITEQEKKKEEERLRALLEADEVTKSKMTLRQKIVKFFDLDLLLDLTFVNLAFGMTVMMFCEVNFSVLTPFILNEYGYTDEQISIAMSLLAGVDISVRFLSPFCLEKVKLGNQVLFAFGIIAILIGRLIITMTSSYNGILAMFVLIGFGKGFRTIFSPLIIPSYVPLKRLPAASGLQLMMNAFFNLACGPILGMITDEYNYTITIHVLNTLTTITLTMWLLESLLRRALNKRRPKMDDI